MTAIMATISRVLKQQEELMQKVKAIENQRGQVAQIVESIDSQVKDLGHKIRFKNWNSLRWRQIHWEMIPPDFRARVLPFLLVEERS